MIDVLHTVDLGLASHIIANIMFECVAAHAWGGANQEQNIELMMDDMKAYYKRDKVVSKLQGKMQIERLRTSKGWPKLKAKAAATRHLAQFALELAERHLDQPRIFVCRLLCRFYQILESEGQFLTASAKEELPGLGRRLGELYCRLAQDALARKVRMWKVSPKLHLFIHLCEWQAIELGNPTFYWVYSDEDLVGQMIEVAQTCHPTTVNATALYKWALLAFES